MRVGVLEGEEEEEGQVGLEMEMGTGSALSGLVSYGAGIVVEEAYIFCPITWRRLSYPRVLPSLLPTLLPRSRE